MSYDESDLADDLQWEYFYKAIAPEAVEDFVGARMTSYYRDHPDVAVPAANLLGDAIGCSDGCPRAAVALAVGAAEVCLKNAILKPVFQGLIHDPSVADAVADLAVRQSGLERFTDFLSQYLSTNAGIDLGTYVLPGSTRTLLAELGAAQKKRNGVLHRGEEVGVPDAQQAITVATVVLGEVFAAVLASMGLHRHDDWTVCSTSRCELENQRQRRAAAAAGRDGN